jgi:hypothetical protein
MFREVETMFNKKNQENIDKINAEFEIIKDYILSAMESTSIKGSEINPILDNIDRSLDKLGCYLGGVGLNWASKNNGLEEMRGYVRKLNILFNGLVKDMYDKSERAQKKGKKFVVPEKRAKALREKWLDFSKELKEKKNLATEKREKREVRKEKLQNLFLPLDFDKKEDTIVNESSEYAQYQKDRELIVKKIAEHFKVEYKAICNWPDEMILQTAENIFGKVDDEKGKSQSFE